MASLIAYFSAEGTTAKAAKELAAAIGAASVDTKLVQNASDVKTWIRN